MGYLFLALLTLSHRHLVRVVILPSYGVDDLEVESTSTRLTSHPQCLDRLSVPSSSLLSMIRGYVFAWCPRELYMTSA